MGQDVLVVGYEEDGLTLIDLVRAAEFPVAAFWAKLCERSGWNLYLVSPLVDEKGSTTAYHIIMPLIRRHPDLAIYSDYVFVLGAKDGIATDAAALRKSKPYPRPIRVRGGTLGGYDLEEAYIYPPLTPTA